MYDQCVAKKIPKENNVDDLKISHVDNGIVEEILNKFVQKIRK